MFEKVNQIDDMTLVRESATSAWSNWGRIKLAQNIASAGPARSRGIFIILGLLLGGIGAHNFYAGYYSRAIIQIVLTLTVIGLFVNVIWILIELVAVKNDASGQPFVL